MRTSVADQVKIGVAPPAQGFRERTSTRVPTWIGKSLAINATTKNSAVRGRPKADRLALNRSGGVVGVSNVFAGSRCLCHCLFLRCGAALVEFFGHLRTQNG